MGMFTTDTDILVRDLDLVTFADYVVEVWTFMWCECRRAKAGVRKIGREPAKVISRYVCVCVCVCVRARACVRVVWRDP